MTKFVDIPFERVCVAKAGKCKEHLQGCAAAKANGVLVEASVSSSRALAVTLRPSHSDTGSATAAQSTERMQAQIDLLNERVDRADKRADWAEAKIGTYDAILTEVLPSLNPPLHANTGPLQLTEAIKIDVLPKLMPVISPSPDWPPEALQMAKEMAALKHEHASNTLINKDRDAQLREANRTLRWIEKRLREDAQSHGYAHMFLNSYHHRNADRSGPKRVRFE